jgi:hypothetical protein
LLLDLHDGNLIASVIITLLIKRLSVHLILTAVIVIIPLIIILGDSSLLALDFKREYWDSYCYQIGLNTRAATTTSQYIFAFLHPYVAPIAFDIAVQLVITIQITKTMLLDDLCYYYPYLRL